jgi:UDPglucose 6-dehydrogenase
VTGRLAVSVLGTGYLGTAHAAGLAAMGWPVAGVDTDPARVAALAAGHVPFHEPGLRVLLRRGLARGRLRFTTCYAEAARSATVHFICVGTPQQPGTGQADLTALDRCIAALAPRLDRPCLVVGKSTVPVGTAARLAGQLSRLAPAGRRAELAWNPEFLREGSAVRDTMRPDRIVIGVRSARAERILRELYAGPLSAGTPLVVTDPATAELAKTAANAFLATKISFINAMAELCESAQADVVDLAEALGHDPRIGHRGLRPGLGFGGGCLPKDIRAFLARAAQLGTAQSLRFLHEVDDINTRCRARVVALASELAGGSVAGRTVGVLGAAFKPDSDDIRDSPALAVAQRLRRLGARVSVFDPAAADRARLAYPELEYAVSVQEAARDADMVALLTEWPVICDTDPEVLGKVVAQRRIIDARHALDPAQWRAAGWQYRAPGRPAAG